MHVVRQLAASRQCAGRAYAVCFLAKPVDRALFRPEDKMGYPMSRVRSIGVPE